MNLQELNSHMRRYYSYHIKFNIHGYVKLQKYDQAGFNKFESLINNKSNVNLNTQKLLISYVFLKEKDDVKSLLNSYGLLNIHISDSQYQFLKKTLYTVINYCLSFYQLECSNSIRQQYIDNCINKFYKNWTNLMQENKLIIDYYDFMYTFWQYNYMHSSLISLNWNNPQLINDFNIASRSIKKTVINFIIELNKYKLLPINYQHIQDTLINEEFYYDWVFLENALTLPLDKNFKENIKKHIQTLAAKAGFKRMVKKWN